jgi:Xaa-Pro dipeptidase
MDELQAKLHKAMAAEGYDAVLALGPDNFTYLAQTSLPFAPSYPDRRALVLQPGRGRPCVVSPYAWAEAISDQGWHGDLVSYPAGVPFNALLTATARALAGMGLAQARIGFDASRMPVAIMDGLKQALPGVQWHACDGMFRALRMVKTAAEQDLLEQAARQADRAIVSALNHTEGTVDAVSYSLAEAAERVRVHVGEFGGSATGHVGAVQGDDARHYHLPPRGSLSEGNLLRFELTNQYRGYWSSTARTVSVGRSSAPQRQAYRENLALKSAAVEMLRPGATCQEVFGAVEAVADREGIQFLKRAGIGHGLGTSEREAPYLARHDPTPLQAGMVLALDVLTYGPRQELVRSVDTYAIDEDGSRLLSWYRNWDRLYEISGVTARHG